MKILSLGLFLMSLVASAGVNSVGKGGGFAEMLTVLADRSLVSQIESCLHKEAFCRPSAEQRSLAIKLLSLLPDLQSKTLSFQPECSQKIIELEQEVVIPSCLLYVKEGNEEKPLEIAKLNLMAIKARLTQAGLDVERNLELLSPLFNDIRIERRSSALVLPGATLFVHSVLLFKNYYQQHRVLVLETAKNSFDVTDLLLKQLSCDSERFNWQAEIEKAFEGENRLAVFQGSLRWNCGDKNYRGILTVRSPLNSDYDAVPDAIRVLVTQKEQVW